MGADLRSYLQSLRHRLHLEPQQTRDLLQEMEDHVEDQARDLQEHGVPWEQAVETAVHTLGPPEQMARQMYAVHSSASWHEAFVAALPHVLFALLIALQLWASGAWILLLIITATLFSFQGWRRGRPKWTYTWLGYSLIAPLAAWFISLLTLMNGGWSLVFTGNAPLAIPFYLPMLFYIPIGLWIVVALVVEVIRRDWLLASLTAFPFPFLISWLVFAQDRGSLLMATIYPFQGAAKETALVFLFIALVTVVFLRVGQRSLRIGILMFTTPLLLLLALTSYQDSPNPGGMLTVGLASVAFLLSPALLEPRVRHKEKDRLS